MVKGWGQMIYPYTGQHDDELTIDRDAPIFVLQPEPEAEWCIRRKCCR